ncbi:uncharacterized protein K460DRAFT_280436, partial [Cucurbitaria berberidis CBS 394.84]
DWALHMVAAALKFSSDTSPVISYKTPDEGRLDILKTLNWFEAHDEYEWPDFSRLGYDFSQAMRFRRALVNDLFVALHKVGHIKITGEAGVMGTPDSVRGVRETKRTGADSKRMTERKRRCKRGDDSDTDIASDEEDKYFWEDGDLLASTMGCLLGRCLSILPEELAASLNRVKDPMELADIVHDGLVEVWSEPRSQYRETLATLKRKAEIWARDDESTTERLAPELSVQPGGAKCGPTAL